MVKRIFNTVLALVLFACGDPSTSSSTESVPSSTSTGSGVPGSSTGNSSSEGAPAGTSEWTGGSDVPTTASPITSSSGTQDSSGTTLIEEQSSTTAIGEQTSSSTTALSSTVANETEDTTSGNANDCAVDKTVIVPDNKVILLAEPADVQALAGVECIEGRVQIYGSAGSLKPLKSLRRISDWLALYGDGFTEGLVGLDGLEFVGGGIGLSNTDMVDLSGLEGVKDSGPINLHLNPKLVSLKGLDGLEHVNGGLYLGTVLAGGNGKLASIAALAGLQDVSGDLEIFGSGLISLDGLGQLTSVGGYARIKGNKSLPTCAVQAFIDGVDIAGVVEFSNNLADQCGG